jgi:hypothetical protein
MGAQAIDMHAHWVPPQMAQALRQLLGRRKRAALDLDQRGGHHQELARDVDVDRVELFQEREILVRDRGDRDVDDVDLRAADQEEEKVERTLETVEADLVIVLEGHAGSVPQAR